MFWKPLALGLPGGLRWVQVEPMETPNVSVMRLEISPEISTWRADGSWPFLNTATVGSDSSSATQGSSTASVPGKKRPPTKQCASAWQVNARLTSKAGAAARGGKRNMIETPRQSERECSCGFRRVRFTPVPEVHAVGRRNQRAGEQRPRRSTPSATY